MSTILRKYGVQTTFDFPLFSVGTNNFKVDAAHASGDSVISKDEGAQANTTNGFVDEGSFYSLTLTATEMEAARISVVIIDQGTKAYDDQMLIIETYGHPSAQHKFDLDTASTPQTGDSYAVADAIKLKTDQLTFTVPGQVDANAESMNGAEILGNGTSGDLWRGE